MAFLAFVMVGIWVLIRYEILQKGWFPSCPVSMLGLYCPGCGSMRAIESILRGNFIQAAAYNLLLVIFIPYFVFWGINLLLIVLAGIKLLPRNRLWFGWTVLAVVLIYTVLRNIPLTYLDCLRPHVLL